MAASSERSSSTSSAPTATGRVSWAETISSTASSERTSRSKAWPTTRSASATSYRIGTAVFEVSQPRVTCYRVGIRMDDPRMPAMLVSHNRPGFYLRVLVEGEVQAGDEIFKVASGPERMTVAEVDALLYLPGHPREGVQRALRIPALSPGWQSSFRALLEEKGNGNAGLAATSPPPAWRWIPSAHGQPARQRERLDRVHPPRRPGRHPRAGSSSRTFSDTPPSTRAGTGVAPAQLLAVRAARRRRLPDQRQARAGRGRQRLPAHAPPSRRPDRDRSTARHVHPQPEPRRRYS